MSRQRIVLGALVTVLAAAAVFIAGCGTPPSSPEAGSTPVAQEQQLKAVVTQFDELLGSVRPARFYGKQLTPVRCVAYMKGRDAQLAHVAAGEAFAQERSGWSTLAGLVRQEQELGHDVYPTAWRGEIAYWRVLSGGGDEYVVRAAVLETMEYGRWDSARGELVSSRSMPYDEAMAWDYTLRRVDGVWKVTAVRGTGLSCTRGGSGLHPDSA